jgi:hypothetical protein
MFADRDLVDGLAGFGPEIDDPAMNRLRLQVESAFRFRISKDFFYDVIADQARRGCGGCFPSVRMGEPLDQRKVSPASPASPAGGQAGRT